MDVSKAPMSQDLFISSVVHWFRDAADDVIHHIMEATFSQDPGANAGPDIFRPSEVQEATTRTLLPVAAERLARWDDNHPRNVFVHGFPPHRSPAQGDFTDGPSFDLAQYVDQNPPSIFVSTTR